MRPLLVVIGGPTASGKSLVALELAKHFNTVVISADSRQVYQEMDIGTAKLLPADQQGVKHYLIDCCKPDEPYSAGKFSQDARGVLSIEFQRHPVIVLCGGTGLFIKGVTEGFSKIPMVPEHIRQAIDKELISGGLPKLVQALAQIDPETYSKIDCQNPRRVLRALEVFRATGKPLSFYQSQQPVSPNFDVLYCVLHLEKSTLHARIEVRTREMIANGLVQETQALLQKGYVAELQSMQTVGYQECVSFLQNKISNSMLVEQIILHTKQYAKRQLTWFKKVANVHWVPAESIEAATNLTLQLIYNQLRATDDNLRK